VDVFFYIAAMFGGSIQYEPEWLLSILAGALVIALLLILGVAYILIHSKTPKLPN